MIGIAENGQTSWLSSKSMQRPILSLKTIVLNNFLNNIAQEAAKTNPASLDSFLQQKYSKDPSLTIDQYRATCDSEQSAKTSKIRRILMLTKTADQSIGIYSHLGGKIVTVVEIAGSGSEEALAKDIAMHIAAEAPEYLSAEKVPRRVSTSEKEIAPRPSCKVSRQILSTKLSKVR